MWSVRFGCLLKMQILRTVSLVLRYIYLLAQVHIILVLCKVRKSHGDNRLIFYFILFSKGIKLFLSCLIWTGDKLRQFLREMSTDKKNQVYYNKNSGVKIIHYILHLLVVSSVRYTGLRSSSLPCPYFTFYAFYLPSLHFMPCELTQPSSLHAYHTLCFSFYKSFVISLF